jgi:hypothetical protein
MNTKGKFSGNAMTKWLKKSNYGKLYAVNPALSSWIFLPYENFGAFLV